MSKKEKQKALKYASIRRSIAAVVATAMLSSNVFAAIKEVYVQTFSGEIVKYTDDYFNYADYNKAMDNDVLEANLIKNKVVKVDDDGNGNITYKDGKGKTITSDTYDQLKEAVTKEAVYKDGKVVYEIPGGELPGLNVTELTKQVYWFRFRFSQKSLKRIKNEVRIHEKTV